MKRKRYTTEFKNQIALETLNVEKTVHEIASSHRIHVRGGNGEKLSLK